MKNEEVISKPRNTLKTFWTDFYKGYYEVLTNNDNDVSHDDEINKNDMSTPIMTTIVSEYEK